MATYVKFEQFVEDLAKGVHNFDAAGHTLKAYLSNVAPVAATHETKSQIAEIAGGNGYTAGGIDIANSISRTGGVLSVIAGTDPITITASGGAIAQFQYVVIFNEDPTSPADPLVCFWDYGSAVDLADGESFEIDFGASLFTLT